MELIKILVEYILPIVYDSFVSLVLVLFVLSILRIKDSNLRILFFFIPLIKPFIAISEKIDSDMPYFYSRPGTGGFRIPDPTNILKFSEVFESKPIIFIFNPNYFILLFISIGILLILLVRWFSLALFYRRLAYEEKVSRNDVPEIYSLIDEFSTRIHIKKPDVSLTHINRFLPFIVGIKNPTMVLSPALLDNLNSIEKKVLIFHELSHIKRNDNLIGWAAMILRDFMFFNPFAYIAYFLIRSEQERGSDMLMVRNSGIDNKSIAKNILSSILKIKDIDEKKPVPVYTSNFAFVPKFFFSQKILRNRVNSILKTNPKKISASLLPRILLFLLFTVLLFIQVMFVIKINNNLIFLR